LALPDAAALELKGRNDRVGLALALSAAICWGCFPSYFRLLSGISPYELVAQRIGWSVVLLAALLPLTGKTREFFRIWRTPRTLALLALSAAMIAINWLVFVICVTTGHVVESSLGYFILPLVNVVLGRIVLKERLSPRQLTACAIAAFGVLLCMIAAGRDIFLSLMLAGSFGSYGVCRKVVRADAVPGVAVENALLMPAAGAYIWWCARQGSLHFGGALPWSTELLIIGTGAITVLPLVLYSAAARLLPMATLGIIFYVNPTMQFIMGVLVYGEPMSGLRFAGCIAIWLALAIYTSDRKTAA
jgi:chloramphenicol-sensitive protein RarD